MKTEKYAAASTLEAAGYAGGYEYPVENEARAFPATETIQPAETAVATFKARKTCGFLKSEDWALTITPESVQFSSPGDGERIRVPKDEGKKRIAFLRDGFFPSSNIQVTQHSKVYVFTLDRAARSALRSWIPKRTSAERTSELRKWGIGLIVLGGVHLVLTGFLDPLWGVLLAGIGILNLLVPKKPMFIVNGLALMLAGVLNMPAGGGWKFFGMLQIFWGIQEMHKLNEYE